MSGGSRRGDEADEDDRNDCDRESGESSTHEKPPKERAVVGLEPKPIVHHCCTIESL